MPENMEGKGKPWVMSETTRGVLETLNSWTRRSVSSEMVASLRDTAQILQKEITKERSLESREDVRKASNELLDLSQAVLALHLRLHRLPRGSMGDESFELYAHANRVYKSWIAAMERVQEVVQRRPDAEERRRLRGTALAQLVIARKRLAVTAEASSVGGVSPVEDES